METYNHYAQAKPLKRSEGQSAVAAAAYRAGEKLLDDNSNVEIDYSPPSGVLAKRIVAPADAPSWTTDRQKLWNTVELCEIRQDAQLARELTLQFPAGLPLETRCEILWSFCEDNFAKHGMVADAVIHAPGEGDQRNDHAHVMLTMRTLTPDGFGNKNRDWNKNECLERWKINWMDRCNATLKVIDSNVRFERRSIADQYADKIAALEAATDWLEKRLLEIEAARRNYLPRPHLPQRVYRAMVDGRPIPDEHKAAVHAWKAARDSKEAAARDATRLQRRLDEELAISTPLYSDRPAVSDSHEESVSEQDALADHLWADAVRGSDLRAGLLVLLAEASPGTPFDILLANLPDHEEIVMGDPADEPRSGYRNLTKWTCHAFVPLL